MAKDKDKEISVKMKRARDTKGTYVYKNDEQGTAIPSLYVKKTAFEGEAPESITVTIKGS